VTATPHPTATPSAGATLGATATPSAGATLDATATSTPGVGATPTAASTPGAPVPVSGASLLLKDRATDATRRTLSFVAKDAAISTAPSSLDPVANGATVQVYNANGSGESLCLSLPSAGGSWTARGDASQPRYGYRDALAVNGPCKTASMKNGKLKLSCTAKHSPIAYSLDEPSQGAMAVRVTSGVTTWCALFGGRVRRDSGTNPPVIGGRGQFRATNAPPPATCPPAPIGCP
jgi:hypothetical protein